MVWSIKRRLKRMRILNIDMEIYLGYTINKQNMYGMIPFWLNIVWSHVYSLLPPLNFMYILRQRSEEVPSAVLSSGFSWKADLGLSWGKNWLNEHTSCFLSLSLLLFQYSLLNVFNSHFMVLKATWVELLINKEEYYINHTELHILLKNSMYIWNTC